MECDKLNEEIEESGTWLAWPLTHLDHSSVSRGQRFKLLCHQHPLPMCGQISEDRPPTAAETSAWTDVALEGHSVSDILSRLSFGSKHSCFVVTNPGTSTAG
ncbi:hypothetical protein PBY51_004306 [Eleginops maclovinus]|uniref:Uncharacterized protein n=1 Tax=Eleginops maclovinus TaxID=56733 RepID=A0AAN8AX00_ELEMC|nr:hypothetical protein PBY51_004306 [Eleginops maclovinus]